MISTSDEVHIDEDFLINYDLFEYTLANIYCYLCFVPIYILVFLCILLLLLNIINLIDKYNFFDIFILHFGIKIPHWTAESHFNQPNDSTQQ